MRTWKIVMVGGLLAAGAGIGCASQQAIRQAQAQVKEARTAGAEARAPYHFTAAEAYLGYAVHESDEWDFPAAEGFALESQKHAGHALEKSKGGAQ